jgi:chitodextrinase
MSGVLNKTMSSSVLEYPTYDEADNCLEPRQAVEQYRAERANNPGALVTIEELHCGEHWKVKVYKSKPEKEQYYRKRVSRLWERFERLVEATIQKSR